MEKKNQLAELLTSIKQLDNWNFAILIILMAASP